MSSTTTDKITETLASGYAAQQAGDLLAAERLYLKVLELDYRNVHALNLLGMLCVNTLRPEQAIVYISRALKQRADDPQAHANIGLAFKDQGNARKAAYHLRKSVDLNPGNAVVHNNLGNVLRLLDRPKDAIARYQAALQIQPDFAECWSNLAAACNEAGEYEAGLRAVERAIELHPELAQAYNNRGDIYLSQARYAEAFESYKKATGLSPKYAAALINMARAQRDMDAPENAMQTLDEALRLEPGNPEAHHVKGVLYEQTGDREKAAGCFRDAISAAPEMAIAHYHLAQIKGRQSSDHELSSMLEQWERDDLTPLNRMYLAFGLSRAFEHRHQDATAFAYLAEGNRIKAELQPYDDDETAGYIESIIVCAEAAATRVAGIAGNADTRPVFVLGMPRSGTSLTEQILASHSLVTGAGELSYAYDTVHRIRDLTSQAFPENMALLSAGQFSELGDYYMSRHAPRNLTSRYVVDKTPLNFQYIGVLGLALPHAKFIHCHRDPVANCFAIHRMPFDKKQTYAHDLAGLGKYYTRYWELMQRWKALFPRRILDVRYEDTVADVEQQSRRMLEFLDLPFEEDVLAFHKTKRLVKTPSASQVREPIYKDSVAAWKKYERYLGPLIENLRVG